MGVLLRDTLAEGAPLSLAADLARYGSSAQWRGVYYHGEKIGFTVSQTLSTEDGYELQEDGRLQLNLMGATTAARHTTRARVTRAFELRSFTFALDPGTGPLTVAGTLEGKTLTLTIKTPSGERQETRELEAPPQLAMALSRQLAAQGLQPGDTHVYDVFDPATLSNSPMRITVAGRELVNVSGRPTPVLRLRSEFSGITSHSWLTEVGEVVRERSPMGLLVMRESQERATSMANSGQGIDLLQAAAVVPVSDTRIDDPRAVARLRLEVSGVALEGPDVQGAGQTVNGNVVEIIDARELTPTTGDTDASRYLAPEPLIESDDAEIIAEAERAIAGASDARTRAERLVRHVGALLEKKPTVSIPSAREVLRTRVGDCNEHTTLYVALARAVGLPARIAVGLVHLHGAFYYHAWPEVYIETGPRRGLWLPVDPTLNQFPADPTHLRLARGGLDRQAEIIGYLGRLQIRVLEIDLRPEATPILVGKEAEQQALPALPIDFPIPAAGGSCWSERD
jgi:hypothetical protein